jgi:hypothetical protein
VKDVAMVLGGMLGVIVALTLLTGGGFSLGTSPAGPFADFTYKGYHG